ncbi:carbohydrate kinase [Marinobacter sp. HL-58]|uniref:carbohydrate kinase family protein n=1 Tax=Marinobacter sp. HL-58 TaxID=1479237 RepID=UPI000488CF12|nr:carbohydrate kinase [Marinobacter sp. HL-58]KPQ02804.1 MAG: fructokinase ScrK [Marinobacter sp. HL-58]
MTDVLCFGEALVDMRGESVAGRQVYIPQPGGAPANVAVGVARLGGRAGFVGQVGADLFGSDIVKALVRHGVDVSLTRQTDDAMTALAFVSLDSQGERSFAFYRNETADLRFESRHCPDEALESARIVHFCSNTLTEPAIRETTFSLVRRARAHGCLVSFDVNYRQPLWPEHEEPAPHILKAARLADIVKFSREELEAQFGEGADLSADLLAEQVQLLLVSDGAGPLQVTTREQVFALFPPTVEARDTTAAGDSFVAGLLFHLVDQGVDAGALSDWLRGPGNLESAVTFASRCGAFAAMHYGAFDALPTLRQLQHLLPETI